jgi:hypothetical protein
MKGKTQKISKPNKLRRPTGMDVHGTFTSLTPALHGAGTADGIQNDPSADTTDPLAALYPTGAEKIYFRTKAQEADLLEDIAEPLLNEPLLRQKLRGQLTKQAGGDLTPTLAGWIEAIVEGRVMRLKITKALAKHGSFRINNKTHSIQAQAIIKDLLLPLDGNLRLNMKAFTDEIARRNQGRMNGQRSTYAVDTETDGTIESEMAVINEMNILLGLPAQTPQQVQEEYVRLKAEGNHG